jgi:hypothetical protein
MLLWVACSVIVFVALQAHGPLLADVDSLYHFQVASLIRADPPWVDISWLPFTVLGDHGPDHHWLFHVLIAPLTAFGHDQRALNLAAAVAAGAVPAAILPFLRAARVPFAMIFALLTLFSTDALPFRFAGLRAQSLALVFMVAAVFAMARRRHLWLALISFLFTESYHGAMILGLLSVVSLGAQWLCERKFDTKIITAVAVGVFAGLMISPWFPRNISYLIFHTVFKTGSSDPFLIGTEWLKPSTALLLDANAVANLILLLAMALSIASRWRGPVRLQSDSAAALALTAVFLAMNIVAWRFVEYYAPFAVVTAGLLLRDVLAVSTNVRRIRLGALTVLVCALAWGIPHGLRTLESSKGERYDAFADFMHHIDAVDKAPMIFNTYWSDFQHMVFWSQHARYAAGLDGNYLRFGSPDRFRLWYDFSTGARLDRHDNARAIAKAFGAKWIVVSHYQPQLADNLAQDANAQLVMARPDSGWLFEINDSPSR